MLRNPASIPKRRGRCACGLYHDAVPVVCGSRPPRFSLLPPEILAIGISGSRCYLSRQLFFHYSILLAA
ncbi:hypothetical protein ABD76_28525 [Paenibacillus dendritiformis]|nr:hypothetical protein [Paenibacillus dendritiformis]